MIKKIRYRLVWNRSGTLNQRGEGLVQIEADQQGRKAYFTTHTYLRPEQFARGCVVNTDLADGLNYALFRMIREVEDIELEYIKKGVEVTLPMLKEAVRDHLSPSAKLTDFGNEVVTNSDRNVLTKQNYKTLFNNLERFRSGVLITDIDYQFVRHTFGTLLGQMGVDIATVSKLLGHQKLQTTEIYREVDRRSIEIELAKAK